jgi:hypothetical protein
MEVKIMLLFTVHSIKESETSQRVSSPIPLLMQGILELFQVKFHLKQLMQIVIIMKKQALVLEG